MRLSIFLLLTVSVVGLGSASADESVEISAGAIRRHVDYLASPELSGRAAGTSGERRAAEYIAAELERQSVSAPPSAERFQSFPFGRGPDGAPRESRNVLGWIPGADAAGTGEVIVLGAHFDHLGEVGGALHPGADDNASGVAAVLEIAAALARKPTPAARSILFVFFGAEEIGLIGSRYFVASPPIDRDRIVAMVNIDMLGRPLVDQAVLAPLKKLFGIDDASALGVVGTRGRPFFAEVVESACATVNLRPFGTQNIPLLSVVVENLAKNRSDHAPFERVGIPTIFFGSGESDDYHGPGDTPDKVRVDLVARRARAIHATVLALAGASAEKLPPRENAAVPAGTPVETLELARGDLKVLLRDNSRSPKILSGVQSLWNVREASDFDAYDPDAPGASAGLNFEHIIGGHANERNSFSPRHGRYELYRLEAEASAMLVRRREDSPWDVSSTLRYTLREPGYVDFEFRCTPWSGSRFGARRQAIFFFAQYMNDVVDPAIHFLGVDGPEAEEGWHAADAPPGHRDWNGGGTYRHRDAPALEYDARHNFRLNSWSYDYPRFTRPFYYGRTARDMVAILMFDRAHSETDEIRFSLFKFKLPKKPRPAWDFQYVIHRVQERKEYGFRARLVWKRWVSAEDCLEEYDRWERSLRN